MYNIYIYMYYVHIMNCADPRVRRWGIAPKIPGDFEVHQVLLGMGFLYLVILMGISMVIFDEYRTLAVGILDPNQPRHTPFFGIFW